MRPFTHHSAAIFPLMVCLLRCASAQSSQAPNVSSVLLTSMVKDQSFTTNNGTSVTLSQTFPNVFLYNFATPAVLGTPSFGQVNSIEKFGVAKSLGEVSAAVSASIATALSVIPLASPASGVIYKTDPSTGAELPVNSTLGPIFTERAETVGKNRFYIGITSQDFHFTSLNGQSLNSLQGLYAGGDTSNIAEKAGQLLKSSPSTFTVGMDVRLSQNTAFLTYGVTNRFDVSVGLPMVHAAVAATSYNLQIYAGNGTLKLGNCWCASTLTPAAAPSPANPNSLYLPLVGQSSLGKTGFGDMLVRFKGSVLEEQNIVIALGADLRLPTGDAKNYLGTGATTIKPFMAVSLYSKRLPHDIVFAPHLNFGWQYSGKSILGGELQGTTHTAALSTGENISYIGAPFTTTKDFLPDVLTWAVGSEVAFGRRNTLVADILGNQIGLVHGIPNLVTQSVSGVYSPTTLSQTTASGLVAAGRTSFSQYYGAFGWKAKIAGNLIATVNFLVRLDNNGLTAKIVPLYGLSYSF